jgi:hypothetical protein
MLAVEHAMSAKVIDGSMLGRLHQPRPGIVGHSGTGPLFKRDQQRFLGQVFCETDVAHEARKPGDQLSGFDSPNSINGAMDVTGRHSTDDNIFGREKARRSGSPEPIGTKKL